MEIVVAKASSFDELACQFVWEMTIETETVLTKSIRFKYLYKISCISA